MKPFAGNALVGSLLLVAAGIGRAGAQPMPAPLEATPQPQQNIAEPSEPVVDTLDEEDAGEGDAGLDPEAMAPDDFEPGTVEEFDETLNAHGRWLDVDGYGGAWAPSATEVGREFSPYATGGHWVLTEYGWTWASDWEWGWAPFHYGRWLLTVADGWVWIPGSTWGPAWVTWRSGGGVVGWAPLGPAHAHVARPPAARTGWRFVAAAEVAARRLRFQTAAALPSLLARTTPVDRWRPASPGLRYNAGPPPRRLTSPTTPRFAVAPLRTLPTALPRAARLAGDETAASAQPPAAAATGPRPMRFRNTSNSNGEPISPENIDQAGHHGSAVHLLQPIYPAHVVYTAPNTLPGSVAPHVQAVLPVAAMPAPPMAPLVPPPRAGARRR